MKNKMYIFMAIVIFLILISIGFYFFNRLEDKFPQAKVLNKPIKIQNTGLLEWKCVLSEGEKVDINCYLFPKTETLKNGRENQKKIILESIFSEKKRNENETDKSSLKLMNEFIEALNKELAVRFPNWENWPNMFLDPVLLEGAEPVKAVLLTNYKNWEADIAFTLYSKKDISDEKLMLAARAVTQELESLNREEWKKFPMSSKPIFDENSNLNSPEIENFTKDAAFIEQH